MKVAKSAVFSVATFDGGDQFILGVNGYQLQVKRDGLYYVDATGTPKAIWGIGPK